MPQNGVIGKGKGFPLKVEQLPEGVMCRKCRFFKKASGVELPLFGNPYSGMFVSCEIRGSQPVFNNGIKPELLLKNCKNFQPKTII